MEKADIYVKNAFSLKRQACYKQAIEMLYKALAIEPTNVEILAELAETYNLLGNTEKALVYIEKVLDKDSNQLSALRLRRNIYEAENNFEPALELASKIFELTNSTEDLCYKIQILSQIGKYDEILNIEPNELNDKILYQLANAHFVNNNLDKALNLLKKAEEINPQNTEVLLLLGKIYYRNNQQESAVDIFTKLESIAKTAETASYIGQIFLDNGQFDKAVDKFRYAVKNNPKNASYAFNLAQAYFLSGVYQEAIKYFNTALSIEPENIEYHYSLAYLYFKKEDFDKSRNILKTIFQLNSSHTPSIILNALIKAKNNDYISAKKEIESILDEKNALAYFSLGKIYMEISQFAKACEMLEQATTIEPLNLDYKAELTEALIANKDYENAQAKIDSIIDSNPNYLPAHVLKAKMNYETENYQEVFEIAQDIINLDANYWEGYYYNALALFELQDENFAIENMKKAIILNVNNASLYVKMGEFYQALGQYENALCYIKEASDIDKSAKNQQLYMQLASLVRKKI